MTATICRRHSMAQLYEKLRAQDDDDDMAWLAQYSPDDADDTYVPVRPPPVPSSISPVSSCSSGSPVLDPFDDESNDDPFDFDSESDVDPEPLLHDLPCTESFLSPQSVFQSYDTAALTGLSDPPFIPTLQETSPHFRSTPPLADESDSPAAHILPVPSIASRRIARTTQMSFPRYHSSIALQDCNEDVFSESDGNGSEDEYVPSPSLGYRKRQRSAHPGSRAAAPSSQKRRGGNPSPKRPRHSPLPRNVQANLGAVTATPVARNNPWACPYCKWVQRNHRTPDLKRHIRTHTRLQRPAQWVCCGVPVTDAANYSIPADAKVYEWEGETMIGGCCKEFSRRDALKRHLDNEHISCIGNFAAFASICEDEI